MAFERARTAMRSIGLAGIVIGALTATGLAQTKGGSEDLTHGLTNPKNGGVAGTGMGTTDKPGQAGGAGSNAAPGTGMSVKGPAGQGITGQTRGMNEGGEAPGTKPVGQ